MKKVIVLSGKARAGKDSCAEFLKSELEKKGNKVVVIAFAKYIKQILHDYYGWDYVKTDFWRSKMQYLGTEKIRQELNRPMFHCSRVCEDIEIIADDFDYVIISDARFQNEVYYTQSVFPNDVITVRVERVGWVSPLTEEQQNHVSEVDLDDFKFDYKIYSQSGLDHLQDETTRVLKGVLPL